jgi:DNA-binding LacI/PurR family transcriptional regulator
MRATIAQVAARAETSPMTVSNVLRGRDKRVSEPTRQRVLEAVRELKYVAVRSAMQNRHVETRIIGLVVDKIQITKSSIGANTYEGLQEGAREHGYDLLTLLRVPPTWGLAHQELTFLDRRCDGFIFVNPLNRQGALELLVEHDIPVAACYSVDVPQGVSTVIPDNATAMMIAVKHLKNRGHSRIAHVVGDAWHSDSRERREWFQHYMREEGLRSYADGILERDDEKGEVPIAALKSILQRKKITAFACSTDALALDVWTKLESLGLQVPRDISIVGMDDIAAGALRGLTTVRNPFYEIGKAAVESVCARMQGQDGAVTNKILPVELIERSSVRAI